ncbi:poly [ADP-ribose] polymerase tankyrase-2-like [Cloeon dipterum]|uniref:poly [ADP-ribose] polymerase tankyrase-2-like n=1 Tax=Cloeon dipterum TaxID=197152 RepID=UPI00322063B3
MASSSRTWVNGICLEELPKGHDDFKYVEDKMHSTIGHSEVTGYNILKVYRINNKYTWPQYVRRRQEISQQLGGQEVEEQHLFHGSPNAHVIAAEGFDTGFAKTSGMFGKGVYFAEHSSKSNNYAFGDHQACSPHCNVNCSVCVRKMLICTVALGRKFETSEATVSGLPSGYHSVKANAGSALLYPEYVIYNDDQVYPSYLIEYTTNYVRGYEMRAPEGAAGDYKA